MKVFVSSFPDGLTRASEREGEGERETEKRKRRLCFPSRGDDFRYSSVDGGGGDSGTG